MSMHLHMLLQRLSVLGMNLSKQFRLMYFFCLILNSNLTSSVQWTSAQVQALFVTALPASAELSQAPASSTIVVVPIVLGILIPLGIFIALGILLYRQFRRKKHDVAKSDSCPESGDDLTNNIRAHLAEARQSYLTQRDAFVQRSSPGSHCSGVIFHPSDLSSEYSQPHTAETPMTVRSASSLLFETHNVIRPLVVRRTSNQRHAPTVANLPRPIRDEFYPRSSSSITPPVPSSPTSSNPAQAWRQPNPPMQWNTEKYPVVEIPRASESTNRSGFIVISNGPRPSYELYAPSTPLQEADLRATSLNRQSRPHELE